MGRQRGMTLMELLFSIGILSASLAIAVPAMRVFQKNQQMNAWTTALYGMLQHAREQAVVRRQPVVLCASGDGTRCDGGVAWHVGLMLFADLNGDRKRQPAEPLLRHWQQAARQLEVHGSVSRQRLRFLPNGTSPGSNTRITLCDDRGPTAARALVLSNTGRVRLERADRGAAIVCK